MNNNVVSKSLAIPFVILTMGVTWTLWWTIAVANRYGLLEYGSPIMMLLYTFGVLAPALLAIILILKSKQMTGKQLFKTICNFRQPLWLYVIVIVIVILSYAIPISMNRATMIAPLYMSILLIPFDLIGGGLEEIGWRFLLQPELEKKSNFITSTLITTMVWAVWHLPLFFIAGTFQFTWNFGVFAILALGLSFILSTIYRISKSVLLCILFHTLWNAIGESIALHMDIGSTVAISIFLIAISFILIKISPKKCSGAETKNLR